MSFNPKTGSVSTLCSRCGTWNDWSRTCRVDGVPMQVKGRRWNRARICLYCGRELIIPDNPDTRHHTAGHNEKQRRLKT